ncbi:hypothetical protein [Gordonia sp. NPDC003950]
MTRVGKVLTFLGVVALALSVGAGVLLAVTGISKVTDQTNSAFEIHGSTTKHFWADESLALYAPGTQNAFEDALPQCTITGPGVQRQASNVTSSFTYNHTTVRSFAQYSFTETGDYVIDCGDGYVVGAPPLAVGGVLSGVGGILLAVFGGLFGLFIIVVGIILWVVGRRRDRRTPPPFGPPGGPAAGPGFTV